MLEWGMLVNKRTKIALGAGFAALLALSACREIEGVDYLDRGHPADPAAPTGRGARMSNALTPENIDVKPELGAIGSASPIRKSRTAPARMDHSMMDHSKMNHSMQNGGGQ